jgi:hypothetical protein
MARKRITAAVMDAYDVALRDWITVERDGANVMADAEATDVSRLTETRPCIQSVGYRHRQQRADHPDRGGRSGHPPAGADRDARRRRNSSGASAPSNVRSVIAGDLQRNRRASHG